MKNPEIDKELIERGYEEFKPGRLDPVGIETKFQKRFDDENGKKYFITVDKWRSWTHPFTGEESGPGYEFTTQFCFCGNPVNINCFASWNIEEAEAKIEEMWKKCFFDYYEMFDTDNSKERESNHTPAYWEFDPDGMDWGIPAWRCSVCGCKNDNIPPYIMGKDGNRKIKNPLSWAGSHYCPNCGAKMSYKEEGD